MPVETAVEGELQHATERWRNVLGRALLLVINKRPKQLKKMSCKVFKTYAIRATKPVQGRSATFRWHVVAPFQQPSRPALQVHRVKITIHYS